MEIAPEKLQILEHFENSIDLYKKTKEIIILIEQFSEDNEPPIHQINEIRNALDHIYRAIEFPSRVVSELNESSEHLYRAAFDSYTILCSILISKIHLLVSGYKRETLASVYPAYFTSVKPMIVTVQKNISKIRSRKEIDLDTNNKEFLNYWENTLYLLDTLSSLEAIQPDLITYEKENKQAALKSRIWTIFGTIITLIVGHTILKWLFAFLDM